MLTKEQILHYSERFAKQRGQNYPCSNQIVSCGIVTSSEAAANEEMSRRGATRRSKNEWLLNNEIWRYIRTGDLYQLRGRRFYKIIIQNNTQLTDEFFLNYLLPCCRFYCCNMEFIE